jgi:hypothetical protein
MGFVRLTFAPDVTRGPEMPSLNWKRRHNLFHRLVGQGGP